MKILFDATELSYFLDKSGHRAGVFFVALNLFRELKRKNIDITFVCNFKRYYFLKAVMELIEEFNGINLIQEHSLINLFFAKLNYYVRKFPIRIQYAVLCISRLYENIFYKLNINNSKEIMNYQIYLSPYTPPNEEIMRAEHIKRFRMLHDIIPILDSGKIPTNKRIWCYRIYNSINNSDFYFANSENTREDILKYFPYVKEENIKTTLLGVNDFFSKNESINNQKYVFSLCTLGKRKNLIFAIKNFFEFIKRNHINDLKLILAGGIWKKFEKELQNTIGEFDTTKIELLGYVPDEKLPELYSNAMMFIYPSLYEGFGLPVLEAMKCGCPVITSNKSSLPEVIGDAGIKINPTNDEEMIAAYQKMYYDNFFRELCRERGLIRAQNYTWEKCANEILAFITEKIK